MLRAKKGATRSCRWRGTSQAHAVNIWRGEWPLHRREFGTRSRVPRDVHCLLALPRYVARRGTVRVGRQVVWARAAWRGKARQARARRSCGEAQRAERVESSQPANLNLENWTENGKLEQSSQPLGRSIPTGTFPRSCMLKRRFRGRPLSLSWRENPKLMNETHCCGTKLITPT